MVLEAVISIIRRGARQQHSQRLLVEAFVTGVGRSIGRRVRKVEFGSSSAARYVNVSREAVNWDPKLRIF